MRKIISLLIVALCTVSAVCVENVKIYATENEKLHIFKDNNEGEPQPIDYSSSESGDGFTIYNYSLSGTKGMHNYSYVIETSSASGYYVSSSSGENIDNGCHDEWGNLEHNTTKTYYLYEIYGSNSGILVEQININYVDCIWNDCEVTNVKLENKGSLSGEVNLQYQYNTGYDNDVEYGVYEFVVCASREAYLTEQDYSITYKYDGNDLSKTLNLENSSSGFESGNKKYEFKLEYNGNCHVNYPDNCNTNESGFAKSSESGVVEKTYTIESNNINEQDREFNLSIFDNPENMYYSFSGSNSGVKTKAVTLNSGNKQETVYVYDHSTDPATKIEKYNFELVNVWDNSKVEINNDTGYELKYDGANKNQQGEYDFQYKLIVPFDELNYMNSGNDIPLKVADNETAKVWNIDVSNGGTTFTDSEENKHHFRVISDYENEIGISYEIVNRSDEENCYISVNRVEKNKDVFEYYLFCNVDKVNDEKIINISSIDENDSLSNKSICLNINNNTNNSIEATLSRSGTVIQRYYFIMNYDVFGGEPMPYVFANGDLTQKFIDAEISPLNDGCYETSTGALYDPDKLVIKVNTESQLQEAIDILKDYDGGHILVCDDIKLKNTLNIDHMTSDSNSFKSETKIDDEGVANYLKIELADDASIVVDKEINVLKNSKVIIVGQDKTKNIISKSGSSYTKALIINNGYLLMDKLSLVSEVDDTHCLNMGKNGLACLWSVSVSGPSGIVFDVNTSETSLCTNGSEITGTVSYAIADLRMSTNNENGSNIQISNSKVKGKKAAIISESFAPISISNSDIEGDETAIEMYKGCLETNSDLEHASYVHSTSGPAITVRASEYNLNGIEYKINNGFYYAAGSNPVVKEIKYAGQLDSKSVISKFTITNGVFESDSNVFDTNFKDFDLISAVYNEESKEYGYQESDYYPDLDKYANISFSEKITVNDSRSGWYDFKEYYVTGSYPKSDSTSGKLAYTVVANREIDVTSYSGLMEAIGNERYMTINLTKNIENKENYSQTILIERPLTLNLNGKNIENYKVEINDPSLTDNQTSTHIINGFNYDEELESNKNTISNKYGPVLTFNGDTTLNGVICSSSYSGGYGISITGNTAVNFNDGSSYTGKNGIELINDEGRPILYLNGLSEDKETTVNVEKGYGVYGHGSGTNETMITIGLSDYSSIIAQDDAAVYTTAPCDMSLFGKNSLVKGISGFVAKGISYEKGSIDTRTTGGKLEATGDHDTKYKGACVYLEDVERYDFEILNSNYVSNNGYCFYLDNSGTSDEAHMKIWDGKFKSGMDYIFNSECKGVFQGGVYSDEICESSFSGLIPLNYKWKQLKPTTEEYPYAIVHELNSVTKSDYNLTCYEYIETLGDYTNPINFDIDEDILASSIDNIGEYSDSGQNVDLVFVVNGDATSSGIALFDESNSGDDLENFLYLDMHITSATSENKDEIHETDAYQHIAIDIPSTYEIDINNVVLKHYENVNGEMQIVTIPKVTPEFARNADSECYYVENNSVILVTKNFSDFDLALSQSGVDAKGYILPTGLNGFVGDALSTVSLPTGFQWKTPTELITAGENKYDIKYDNIITEVKVNGVATSVIGENSVSGSASGLLDANDITKAQKQFIIDSLTKDDVVSEKIRFAVKKGDNVSLKVNVNVADTSESGIAADIAKLKNSPTYGNQKIIGVYTIDVEVMINGSSFANVTELSKGIEFKFDIPTDLPAVANGFARKFSMMTVHNNVLSELGSSVVGDKLKVNITGFSTFMLCYRDYANPVRRHNYVTTNTSVK